MPAVGPVIAIVSALASTAVAVKGLTARAPKMPKIPEPPSAPTLDPITAAAIKKRSADAALQQRQRAAAASGRSDTILTKGLGAPPASTQQKTLLGY